MTAPAVGRILPPIVPAIFQARNQGLNAPEVLVVAPVLLGEEGVDRVMKVIGPLGIEPVTSVAGIAQESGVIQITLGDKMNWATQSLRQLSRRRLQFGQEVMCAEIKDSVDRIQPQAIEMIVFEPVQRVLAKKSSHVVAARTVEIYGLTPWCSITVGEIWCECTKVVAFRPEMVVNHVQHGGQPMAMDCVHQSLQRRGAAVGTLRRILVHAVVSPVSSSGELGHRHDLHRRYPEFHKALKVRNDGFKGP